MPIRATIKDALMGILCLFFYNLGETEMVANPTGSEVLQQVITHTRHLQLAKQKLRDDPNESWRHDYLDGAIETLQEIRIHFQGLGSQIQDAYLPNDRIDKMNKDVSKIIDDHDLRQFIK